MSLLVGVFSDTHIGNFKKFNVDGSRLKNSVAGFERIIETLYPLGITKFFFGGDLGDTAKVLEINVAVEIVRLGVRLRDKYPDLVIFAIDGNHDHYEKNLLHKPTYHTGMLLESVMGEDRFVIVSNTYAQVGKNIFVHGIPYYEIKEDFEEARSIAHKRVVAMKETFPESKHYLLIHQTPRMIDMEFIPHDTDPSDAEFKVFDHVFCGHIHGRVELAHNFTLIGNNIHRDATDRGKEKGYYVINVENAKKTFKYLPGFPEYVEMTREEMEESEVENLYVIEKAPELTMTLRNADSEKFSNSLDQSDLVKNYWQEIDGKDEELLTAGLSCLNTVKNE